MCCTIIGPVTISLERRAGRWVVGAVERGEEPFSRTFFNVWRAAACYHRWVRYAHDYCAYMRELQADMK